VGGGGGVESRNRVYDKQESFAVESFYQLQGAMKNLPGEHVKLREESGGIPLG